MKKKFEPGQIVTGLYNTGKYIGEVVEDRGQRYLIQVLAILKHPKQGDIHQHKSVDVDMFHERRALGYMEKTNIPRGTVKLYEESVPEYKESLRKALDESIEELSQDDSEWAKLSLQHLRNLENNYFNS